MKMTTNKILLNVVMVAGLVATAGCWTSNGNQPGGDGEVGGSFGSNVKPMKSSGVIASARVNSSVGDKGAQIAMGNDGNSVSPSSP